MQGVRANNGLDLMRKDAFGVSLSEQLKICTDARGVLAKVALAKARE